MVTRLHYLVGRKKEWGIKKGWELLVYTPYRASCSGCEGFDSLFRVQHLHGCYIALCVYYFELETYSITIGIICWILIIDRDQLWNPRQSLNAPFLEGKPASDCPGGIAETLERKARARDISHSWVQPPCPLWCYSTATSIHS